MFFAQKASSVPLCRHLHTDVLLRYVCVTSPASRGLRAELLLTITCSIHNFDAEGRVRIRRPGHGGVKHGDVELAPNPPSCYVATDFSRRLTKDRVSQE